MQGDFQRTFIMMRPLDGQEGGGTGFCRVERKQNRGKLIFNVQGQPKDAEVHAILIRQEGGQYQVTPCGAIRLDARGQGTVTRDLDGVSAKLASGYRAVGVVSMAGGQPRLSLAGFFGTGKQLDRGKIEAATAVAMGIQPESAKTAPSPSTPSVPKEEEPQEEVQEVSAPAPQIQPEVEPEAAVPAPEANDPPEQTKQVEETAQEEIDTIDTSWEIPENPPPVILEIKDSGVPESIWSAQPLREGEFPAVGLPEELEGIVWPDSLLPLRTLFERFEVVSPVTGNDSEVFIRVPMTDCIAGVDHYLLGVRLAGGTIIAVGYAIPGTAQTPPTGLTGYTFTETPLGGYWIKWEDVVS